MNLPQRSATSARLALPLTLGLTLSLALGLALPRAGSAEEPKKIERREVIWIDKDGETHLPLAGGGYLGAQLLDLTTELCRHFGVVGDGGVLVAKVEEKSPAEKAGLAVGDVLTAIDGEAVASTWDVKRLIRAKEEGETAALEAIRDRKVVRLSAQIAVREPERVELNSLMFKRKDGEGIVLQLDPDQIGRQMKQLEGVTKLPDGERRVEVHRIEAGREAEALEKALKALERRIAELERELEKKQ